MKKKKRAKKSKKQPTGISLTQGLKTPKKPNIRVLIYIYLILVSSSSRINGHCGFAGLKKSLCKLSIKNCLLQIDFTYQVNRNINPVQLHDNSPSSLETVITGYTVYNLLTQLHDCSPSTGKQLSQVIRYNLLLAHRLLTDCSLSTGKQLSIRLYGITY